MITTNCHIITINSDKHNYLSQGKKVTIKLTNIQDQSFNFSFSYFKYPNITNIRMKVDIYREKANSSRETAASKTKPKTPTVSNSRAGCCWAWARPVMQWHRSPERTLRPNNRSAEWSGGASRLRREMREGSASSKGTTSDSTKKVGEGETASFSEKEKVTWTPRLSREERTSAGRHLWGKWTLTHTMSPLFTLLLLLLSLCIIANVQFFVIWWNFLVMGGVFQTHEMEGFWVFKKRYVKGFVW